MYITSLRSKKGEEEEEVDRLTRANPRSTIERQEMEPRQQTLPSLRSELLGILAPEILTAVHGVEDPDDHLALLHKNGALPVRATASR